MTDVVSIDASEVFKKSKASNGIAVPTSISKEAASAVLSHAKDPSVAAAPPPHTPPASDNEQIVRKYLAEIDRLKKDLSDNHLHAQKLRSQLAEKTEECTKSALQIKKICDENQVIYKQLQQSASSTSTQSAPAAQPQSLDNKQFDVLTEQIHMILGMFKDSFVQSEMRADVINSQLSSLAALLDQRLSPPPSHAVPPPALRRVPVPVSPSKPSSPLPDLDAAQPPPPPAAAKPVVPAPPHDAHEDSNDALDATATPTRKTATSRRKT